MARPYGINMRYLIDHLFNDELNELGEYIGVIEGALKKNFDEFGDDLDRRTATMDEQRKAEYIEMLTDDAFQLADRFPTTVRRTAFVFLYGLFEHSLLNLCGHVKRYGKFKESATGGKDKGVTAAQMYLKNVAKVKFPDQTKEWNEIKQLADIRNWLTHRQGRVKDEPTKALLQYIKNKNGLIELTGMNEVKLNAGYCEDAIEVIRKFFAATLQAVPDKYLQQTVDEEVAEIKETMKQFRYKTNE